MYPASNAFHNAVRNGNKQMAMLIFPDAVFTNEDIDVSIGIEFNDYFNAEDDLAVGQALSNEISFSLFNDYRDLNSYEFGDFTATLGVMLTSETYTETANCSARVGNDIYTGYTSRPYIMKNGTQMASQPNFAVQSIIAVDNTVYAFGADGMCKKWVNGAAVGFTVNNFMKRKMTKWQKWGFGYDSASRLLTKRNGRTEETYEFVPLGNFTADRPNAPDKIEIDFRCYDWMQKLDKDLPTSQEMGVTYPTTIGTLYEKVCEYYEVPYATSTFINSTGEVTSEPEEFGNCTGRKVIGWIAEAAASVARFNRDGILIMDWVRNSGVSLDENGYSNFEPYWYETQSVDKLYNRSTSGEEEQIYGSGDVGYLIQDNPLLKGVS